MVLGSAGKDVADFLRIHYPDEALGILTYAADGGRTSLRAQPAQGRCRHPLRKAGGAGRSGRAGPCAGQCAGRHSREALPRTRGSGRGCYHVEGQASQLAALCVEAKPGETVLDLCAAPGGKTLLLAEEMQGTGRPSAAMQPRTASASSARQWSGWALPMSKPSATMPPGTNPSLPQADRILVDAPCSGLGILAKKPDIRYKTLDKARHR